MNSDMKFFNLNGHPYGDFEGLDNFIEYTEFNRMSKGGRDKTNCFLIFLHYNDKAVAIVRCNTEKHYLGALKRIKKHMSEG